MLTEFTDERRFFTEREIIKSSDKLMRLCKSLSNESLSNMINLIGAYAIKDAKQPIHDLVISFELPAIDGGWNQENWFELCIKEKKALKLLVRADNIESNLRRVPKNY